jgi:hypothetical protein
MMKMKGIMYLLAVSVGLLTSSSVAGLSVTHEPGNGDESYMRSTGNTESLPSQHDHEIAAAQAIFRDFDFTRSLRERELQVASNDICLPFGETCSGTTDCCRGGCNSQKECFCQASDGLCFNPGQTDSYCCSNRCKSNGRCACINGGASCSVGNDFCCEGYTCGDHGLCVKVQAATNSTTKEDRSTCTQDSYVCFNDGEEDDNCCSKFCGSNGRCTPAPTPGPTPMPTVSVLGFTSRSDVTTSAPCADPTEIKLTVEVETDKFGSDVGWSITAFNSEATIAKVVTGTYGLYDRDQVDVCVPPGRYTFTLTDAFGDGVCCMQGDGHVKVYLNYREVLYLTSYGKVVSEVLNVGFDPSPTMSTRDYEYLDAHNRRRFAWFVGSNVSDVPLVWSPTLAEESRVWAEELLVNCSGAGIEHEFGVDEGENLAKNTGTLTEDGLGWGQVSEESSVCFRHISSSFSNAYYCLAIFSLRENQLYPPDK